MKYNSEVRLLIKILAVAGFIILLILLTGYIFIRIKTPHLLEFSKGITEYRISVELDSLEGAQFVTGMTGCENILPEKDSTGVYVSCLNGYLHYLGKDASGNFQINKTYKAGNAVTGLASSADGSLYAVVYNCRLEEWKTTGGAVYYINHELTSLKQVSGNYPAMNGICFDSQNSLYFASSNFKLIHADGKVFRMKTDENGSLQSPVIYVPDAGAANGLYYDAFQDKIFFSNTLGGVYAFTSEDNSMKEIYLKLRFMEACDDICTDISGNIWMTDPGQSTIKIYNPGTGRLVRFNIEGMGQTSSCRIRSEKEGEVLYITELKQSQSPMSSDFNGRGVLIVPAKSLLKLLEPILIKNNQP